MNLENLAKDRVTAENSLDGCQAKRDPLLGRILEAEDSGNSKKLENLKKDLTELDQQIDLLKTRLSSIDGKMKQAAENDIQDRLRNLPREVKIFNEKAVQVEHQLAEHLAGAAACAGALGMGDLARRIGGLLKSPSGYEDTPETIRLSSFVDQARQRTPEVPNVHAERSKINQLRTLQSNPALTKNNVERLVKGAIGKARRGG